MTTAKVPFEKAQSANLPIDERGVIALEYIAHYLDRIESHLKRISRVLKESESAGPQHQRTASLRPTPQRRPGEHASSRVG